MSLLQEERTITRLTHAMEIDRAIMDLARVIADTAVDDRCTAQYGAVLGSLVKARRALKEAFDL